MQTPYYYDQTRLPMSMVKAGQAHRRLNIVAVVVSFFIPWLVFCLLYALLSFSIHYTMPFLTYLTFGVALLLILSIGALAFSVLRRPGRDSVHGFSWYLFLFATSLLAWVLALWAGGRNFASNMQPFYDIMSLNNYTEVNPAETRGQMLMDAGRVRFVAKAQLDLRRAMSFKNLELYCVAPIVMPGELHTTANYDYWAVGKGCCHEGTDGGSVDFSCGAFDSWTARSGVRLTRDDERDNFRLAVRQAESAYNIMAPHPLFFHWVEDSEAAVVDLEDDGYRSYFLGMCGHFVFQLCAVVLASLSLSKAARIV